MDSRKRGRWAEDATADELVRRGFRVVGRNVRLQRGEIDLVAVRGGVLWFVETKSRGRMDRGAPHLAITPRKKRAMFACAREYVTRSGHRGDYGFLAASVLPAEGNVPQVQILRLTVGPPGD